MFKSKLYKNILIMTCAALAATTAFGMKQENNLNTNNKDYKYKIGPFENDVVFVGIDVVKNKLMRNFRTKKHKKNFKLLYIITQDGILHLYDREQGERISQVFLLPALTTKNNMSFQEFANIVSCKITKADFSSTTISIIFKNKIKLNIIEPRELFNNLKYEDETISEDEFKKIKDHLRKTDIINLNEKYITPDKELILNFGKYLLICNYMKKNFHEKLMDKKRFTDLRIMTPGTSEDVTSSRE